MPTLREPLLLELELVLVVVLLAVLVLGRGQRPLPGNQKPNGLQHPTQWLP